MSRSSLVHWGILGPGRIAHTFAQAMQVVDSGEITLVHSSDHDRAMGFAEQFNISNSTNDLDDFLASPNVDAVYIAYPHAMHFDAVVKCLNAGKHVLCEKPLTISLQQAEQVISLAKKHNLFLMEALWSRFLPIWDKARTLVNEKLIGDLVAFSSTFGFKANFDLTDRLFNPALAGGAIWDLGVYPIAMSNFLISGEPETVSAKVTRGDTGVDEHVAAVLNYGEVNSEFIVSLRQALENQFIIHGTKGKVVIDEPFWGAEKLTYVVGEHQEHFIARHEQNGFEYQIRSVNESILQSEVENNHMTWRDTVVVQRVMDHILSSK